MKLRLKTVCPEQLGPLPDGEYEVTDGCAAAQALRECAAAAGLADPAPETLARLLYMRNRRHVSPDTPLSDGDSLTVLRPLVGG